MQKLLRGLQVNWSLVAS